MTLLSAGLDINISIAPKVIFNIGSFQVTETMLSGFVTMIVLLIIAVVIRIFFIPRWRKEARKKSGFRILLEYLVNTFSGNAKEMTGHNSGFIGAFYFAAAGYIFIGTLLEMTGLRPPTSDLSLTLSFGLITFILIIFFGLKERKARRLLHYLNPLNTLSDFILPFSLALRMFGSVFSGYLIMHLIYTMLPHFVLYMGIPAAAASIMFTLFHALIQSFIFMFLSMSFIAEATE